MSEDVVFVCVATESKLYLPYLQRLLPSLVVLGLGSVQWRHFSTKYRLLRDFLQSPAAASIGDDAPVCVIDAYDILPTRAVTSLGPRFAQLLRRHPKTRIVIGHDCNANSVIEHLFSKPYFGELNQRGDRLNGGQFIGRKRDVLTLATQLLRRNPDFVDDQVELTRYANAHPDRVWIDRERHFFCVCNLPLEEIDPEIADDPASRFAFVHANSNGALNSFLRHHWGIHVPLDEQLAIFVHNRIAFAKKTESISRDYLRRISRDPMSLLPGP